MGNRPGSGVKVESDRRMRWWKEHPVEFAEIMLLGLTPEEIAVDDPHKRLEPETKRMLETINRYDYVSIHAGRGVTKTTTMAMSAIHFCYTRRNAKIIITGPKFEQLKITTWMEIRKWIYYYGAVSDRLKWTAEKLVNITPGYTSFAQLMTAREKENLAGIHAESVLWIIDEASNVDDVFVDAILGGLTDPESKIVMAGNPTKATGAFYDSFNKHKDLWKVLHFSAETCARANPVWLAKMRRLPRESDPYRVWVLGLPPSGNPRAVIMLSDCEMARARTVIGEDPLEIGLDPASEGNDLTAICVRHGMKVLEIRTFAKLKAQEIVVKVCDVVREFRAKKGYRGTVRIKVDDTGYGMAIRQLLAVNQGDNIEVVPCLFGGKGNEQYGNHGTIMWFDFRDLLHLVELPDDEDLLEELSTREWMFNGGKMVLEPKVKYKERLGRSPDRADATVLAFAKGDKKIFGGESQENRKVYDFLIDWNCEQLMNPTFKGVVPIDIAHFVGMYLGRDLSLSVLFAFYEFFRGNLWVYDEFKFDFIIPDRLVPQIKHVAHLGLYEDNRNARVLGNSEMFRPQSDRRPLASILLENGLSIMEPRSYDEYGALAMGGQLFSGGKIIFHENCTNAITQTSLWSIKGGIPGGDDAGMCKALLLVLSEARHHIKEHPAPLIQHDYHPVYEQVGDGEQRVRKPSNSWMSR